MLPTDQPVTASQTIHVDHIAPVTVEGIMVTVRSMLRILIRGLTHRGTRHLAVATVVVVPMVLATALPASGQDVRPYDDRMLRLSEILGAVHYLRELCGANDGQIWRNYMRELMDSEGGSALRKARMTRSFNNGYRSFSRSYTVCSPSAETAIARFIAEGAQLTDNLIKTP